MIRELHWGDMNGQYQCLSVRARRIMSAGRDLASCQRRPQSTQQSHGDQSHCKFDLTTKSSVFCAVAAKMAMIHSCTLDIVGPKLDVARVLDLRHVQFGAKGWSQLR